MIVWVEDITAEDVGMNTSDMVLVKKQILLQDYLLIWGVAKSFSSYSLWSLHGY